MNTEVSADITALCRPIDSDFVSIADAIADVLKDDSDGTRQAGLAPDTRRRLQQALTAALQLTATQDEEVERISAANFAGDVQDAVYWLTRMNALAQWIEAARFLIDNVRHYADNYPDFAAKLRQRNIRWGSPCWDDWENAGLEHLHIAITERLSQINSTAERVRTATKGGQQ